MKYGMETGCNQILYQSNLSFLQVPIILKIAKTMFFTSPGGSKL